MNLLVREKDQRPAGMGSGRCFYCKKKVGEKHRGDCVIVVKKVMVKVTVEMEIEVPASWGQDMVEFRRNESSWCADNAVNEIVAYKGVVNSQGGCMCPFITTEYVCDASDAYLSEG